MAKDRELQVEAIERKSPKIFDVENKLKIDSSKLSEVKDWKVGKDYKVEISMTELASRELNDGTIEAEFEIKGIKNIT